jgi:hypothetical protein
MTMLGSYGSNASSVSYHRPEYPARPNLKLTSLAFVSPLTTQLFCCLCQVNHASVALSTPCAIATHRLTPLSPFLHCLAALHTLPSYLLQRVSL